MSKSYSFLIAIGTLFSLFQPWFIKLGTFIINKWRASLVIHINRKGYLNFTDVTGLFLKLKASVMAEHETIIIADITVELIRNDTVCHSLEWQNLGDPYSRSFSVPNMPGSITQNTNVEPHFLILSHNHTTQLLDIMFYNHDLIKEVKDANQNQLITLLNIKKGEYDLRFKIINTAGKEYIRDYKFELNEDDEKNLHDNANILIYNREHPDNKKQFKFIPLEISKK